MATADLPGAVKTTVEAKFPKAKLAKAEKVTKGTEVSYSVVVKTPKGNVTLDVDTTGKVLKEEMPKGKVK